MADGFQANGTTVSVVGAPSGLFDNIVGMSLSPMTREMINDTDFATVGGMTFFGASNWDPGVLSVTVKPDMTIDPDLVIALDGALTVVFSDAGATNWGINGKVQSNGFEFPFHERVEQTIEIKLSGDFTVTP